MEQLGFQGPNRGGGGLVVDNSTVSRVISCGSFGLSLNLYFFSVSSLIGSRNTSFSAKKNSIIIIPLALRFLLVKNDIYSYVI